MKRLLAIVMWGAVLGIGCASTIRVKETANGGEIQLSGNRGQTMDLATPIMAARCRGPKSYDIVEDTGADADTSDHGDWRLTYVCKPGAQNATSAK